MHWMRFLALDGAKRGAEDISPEQPAQHVSASVPWDPALTQLQHELDQMEYAMDLRGIITHHPAYYSALRGLIRELLRPLHPPQEDGEQLMNTIRSMKAGQQYRAADQPSYEEELLGAFASLQWIKQELWARIRKVRDFTKKGDQASRPPAAREEMEGYLR
jgi:hypothetical protein